MIFLCYLLDIVVVNVKHTSDDITIWSKVVECFIPGVNPIGPIAVFMVISL